MCGNASTHAVALDREQRVGLVGSRRADHATAGDELAADQRDAVEVVVAQVLEHHAVDAERREPLQPLDHLVDGAEDRRPCAARAASRRSSPASATGRRRRRARSSNSAASLADDAHRHQRETQRLAPLPFALFEQPASALDDLVVGRERRVVLVRPAHGGHERPAPRRAADDQRRVRLLHRLRERGAALERVVPAREVEAVLGPLAVHDLELLGEQLHPHARLGEREAERAVLGLHPAAADAEPRHGRRRCGRPSRPRARAPTGAGTSRERRASRDAASS